MIFAVSVTQINMLVDTFIASFLPKGSLSWLYYADRIMEFPLGVFGIALATVLLPSLSVFHASDRPDEGSRLLDLSLRWSVLIGLPAAIGLFVLAGPIMITLFTYNAFSADDAGQAALALCAYTVGVPALIIVKVLAVGHFARLDVSGPARIAVISVGANLLFNLIFVWHLAHVGLALATSSAAWVQAWLLFRTVRRHGYAPMAGWPVLFLRLLLSCSLMVGFIYMLAPVEALWLHGDVMYRVLWLLLLVVGGCSVYIASLFLSGFRLHHVLQTDGSAEADSLKHRTPED